MRTTRAAAALAVTALLTIGALGACTPPDPSTPTTAPPTTTGPSVTFPTPTCGTFYAASGWPTTMAPSPALFDCIVDAFTAGTPATFAERFQTDGYGGHIEIHFYEVTGAGRVKVTVDATGAEPPGGVTVQECTSLTAGFFRLATSGCTPA